LVREHDDVTVYDLDPERVAMAVDQGATAAVDASAVGAASEIVVVSLPNPDAVRAALPQLFEGASPGTVVVDTSTVSPDASRELHALASARGIGYLDAPVSGGEPMQGGVDGARAASMTFMIGGDADAVEKARPVLETLGSHFFHLGPAGSGTEVKLISNLCSGIYALVAAEAFALGAACGFSAERLTEVFQHTDAKSFFMTDYLVPRLVRGDVTPGFTIELQLKDHRLANELGDEKKVPLPLNALATVHWERLRAAGRGGNDVVDAIVEAVGA
jgi:3-hydroxyisobutyrate dehydrogenase-like beta-hydroxyacid dehydrogenase